MDCNSSQEMTKHEESPPQEDAVDVSVKRAMECLRISTNGPTLSSDGDHCSDFQITEEYAECETNQQNCKQTDQLKDETRLNSLDTQPETQCETQSSKAISLSMSSESTAQDISTGDTNEEEVMDSINYEKEKTLTEDNAIERDATDNRHLSDNCEPSGSVSQNEINNVNAVIDSEGPPPSRYPLKYRWQLWFWRADQGIKVVWERALQRVCKPFDTVEHFWRLYHHIIPVKQLVPPSDYCVFKEGITPKWEDSRNINGGKWTLDFPKGPNREVNPHLDEIWLEVLLCLIGEGFNEFGEEICGAVVNIRSKEDRISVWTSNANKSVANLKIGEILKIRSGYEGKIKYEAHSTTQRIAEAKDRLFDTKLSISSKPRSKPYRRSCVF